MRIKQLLNWLVGWRITNHTLAQFQMIIARCASKMSNNGIVFFCVAYFFARCFRHRSIFSFALLLLKLSLYWQMFNCMQMSAPNGWNFFFNYKKIWVERKKNKMLFATFHIWIVTKFKTVYTFAQNCMYRVFDWIIKFDKHTHRDAHRRTRL